jgi:hypothetical protein
MFAIQDFFLIAPYAANIVLILDSSTSQFYQETDVYDWLASKRFNKRS